MESVSNVICRVIAETGAVSPDSVLSFMYDHKPSRLGVSVSSSFILASTTPISTTGGVLSSQQRFCDGLGIAMRNATCTAGVGVDAGDEESEEGEDNAGPAIGSTGGCGDGNDRLLVKDRMNREGRNEGCAEFSAGGVGT